MTLRQKQSIFAFLVARLIIFAKENGYEITLGHALRDPDSTIGIKDSLKKKKLAIDLNLFKDGKYLTKTESHKLLGEWWERQHLHCRWGGRWEDGNHYEFTEKAWR